MQDFTGVPAVVDLAAMRDGIKALGGDPQKINPLNPVDLVIDHSVMIDEFGNPRAFQMNVDREYERNMERYTVPQVGPVGLRQLPRGAPGHRHLPPGEPRVPRPDGLDRHRPGRREVAYPDTLVGTDSHTTMVNGAAVLGWGVGGIEAEAAMLGQPISMLIPEVVGFKLTGADGRGHHGHRPRAEGRRDAARRRAWWASSSNSTAPGSTLPLADRATIANMAPEYGATCGFFPIDAETCATCATPAATRRASRWSRPMPRRTASGAGRTTRRSTPTR
jgi:aconitate hydratase